MPQDDALLREFLLEVKENLDALDQSLVQLEQSPGDVALIDAVFRSLHSTKGAAGFFGFGALESVAHTGENLLTAVREGNVALDANTIGALLQALDALREIAHDIDATGAEAAHDYGTILGRMDAIMRHEAAASAALVAPRPRNEADAPPPALPRTAPAPATAPVPPGAHAPGEAPAGPTSHDPGAAPAGAAAHDAGGMETIRVDVHVLDELMDLVGELVLSRNRILQVTQGQDRLAPEIAQSSQQLDRITTELQERVMKTRMQPIKQVWSKFPRVVRDLSHQLGKRVRLEMEGEETELDRTLIEAIKDPLTHLVRNGVDHGIERPDVRVAAGKDAEGRFSLRAFHESGQVIVEIEDDGAGIDVERLKRKAVERGLITDAQAATMSPKEGLRLIFRPGLSTAEKVTNISGRGVGMDVVRSNIERIGGTIEVDSKMGEGTRFRVKIPLTLAIIPALLVTCDHARFAIPQVSVLELIRLKGEDVVKSIESVHGTRATRLRGQILPLLDLRELLGAPPANWKDRGVSIVVAQASKHRFGLLVDGVEEAQEIVVKPLSRQLQDIPLYAGATILGDGGIALILDTAGVAQHGRLLADAEAETATEAAGPEVAGEKLESYLMLRSGEDSRLVVPLSSVARLEKFQTDSIERTGDAEVVQYRGRVLPLRRLRDVLGGGRPATQEAQRVVEVVVFHSGEGLVGLVVDGILDIVEMPAPKLQPPARRGVLGTTILRDRVTEMLDVGAVLSRPEAMPHA